MLPALHPLAQLVRGHCENLLAQMPDVMRNSFQDLRLPSSQSPRSFQCARSSPVHQPYIVTIVVVVGEVRVNESDFEEFCGFRSRMSAGGGTLGGLLAEPAKRLAAYTGSFRCVLSILGVEDVLEAELVLFAAGVG